MSRLLLITALLLSHGWACKVPVFRYALERWEADDYRAAVFFPSKQSGFPTAYSAHANLTVETIYLDALTEEQQWQYADTETLGLRLYYPSATKIEEPFWESTEVAEALGKATRSPVRDQIVEALLSGSSTVWVLVESGDAAKDDATHDRLKQLLDNTAQTLELPEGVVRAEDYSPENAPLEMDDVLRTSIPLKIEFPIIRLNPKAKEEAIFGKMLTGFMRQLPADEPIAVPVFGRGRALEGIPASHINENTIHAACAYLCGECSCQVKDQNPGIDLLLEVDWSSKLQGSLVVIERQLPPLTGLMANQVSSKVKANESSETKISSQKTNRLPRSLALTAGGLLILLLLTTYWYTNRQ